MKPAFDGNFVQLLRAMNGATRAIDAFPEDQEWTQDQLATMDDIRHAAARLADRAEALIKEVDGR
jgi:hypothetical protein